MPGTSKNVYCYRVGSEDCFKVGRTKNEPEKRKRGFSTGSPVKFQHHKTIEHDEASRPERYIHQLLDLQRTENGEFFNVTAEQLDEAIVTALAFVNETGPLLAQSKKLSKKKPHGTTVAATDEMLGIYAQLRAAHRDRYLLARRIEHLQCKVQVALGGNRSMPGVASWDWVERWTMDVDPRRSGRSSTTSTSAIQAAASSAWREST